MTSPIPPITFSPRKSTRIKQLRKYLEIYKYNLPSHFNLITQHFISFFFLSLCQLSPSHHAFTTFLSQIKEPHNFHQAVKYVEWQASMKAKMEALNDNRTWSIVPFPHYAHAIGCKWVYKFKMNVDGSVERYKARFVIKVYSKREGFDYTKIFNLVTKQTIVNVFLALTAIYKWHLSHLNINNAFLNGDLDEIVYMDFTWGL